MFKRMGKICDANSFDLGWFRKNAMVPVPWLKSDSEIRLFLTMCDEKNVGRIGFVDVSAANPSEILGYSKKPLIDIGQPGTYDDNGVVSSCITEDDGKLYHFFSGYELSAKIPYKIFCGVAESDDGGNTFRKLNKASILPPIDEELFNRCAPYVRKEGDGYRMFYLGDAGNAWRTDRHGHKVPMYTLKTLRSNSLTEWPCEAGNLVMPFADEEECGITLPNIWKEGGGYRMVYSIRRVNSGYSLGYAESDDGVAFTRKDEELEFTGHVGDWESEMMCYAELITVNDRTLMFYCGNHYGIGGIGWAELVV